MIWVTREDTLNSDELKAFDAQTHSDLKALLLAALAGVVLAFVIALLLMAAMSMTAPA
jgi:hypothetical protein